MTEIWWFYVIVGPFLWGAQMLGVITMSALAWRGPAEGWPSALQGRTASLLAFAIAGIFSVLMSPVALMVHLRRNNGMYATSWTDPIGLSCITQLVLLVAAGVNAIIVYRAR
jgi:hypothetical protein